MPRPGRRWRFALAALLLVASLLAMGFAGLAWHYANLIHNGAFALEDDIDEFDVLVTAVGAGTVTLQSAGAAKDGNWQRDGLFGLEWTAGYAQVEGITAQDETTVTRELRLTRGTPIVGQRARVDSYAFRPDPGAVGLRFDEVSVETPVGVAPAWLVAGRADMWCIFVHGKGAARGQALRILPTLSRSGCTVLAVSYRNDAGVPKSRNHRYSYGETEWEDLAAAIEFARDRGARRFLLIGYSQGASIILSLMDRPHYAALVAGVIFDAPVLDLRETVDLRAKQQGLPRPLTIAAEWLAAKRFDIDWEAIAYLKRVDKLTEPVLVIHGESDRTVPIATSEKLAARRPDIVTVVRFPTAHHVDSWNVDPDAYTETVRAFLTQFDGQPAGR